MTTRRQDMRFFDGPLGPLRDKFAVANVNTSGYELETGFICQVGSAGNITYRTLDGTSDQVESGLMAGDTITVGGVPVLLSAVRATGTTVTSIVVGVV